MNSSIRFRSAHRSDASALWRLVKETGTLELNSSYFYLAFAEFFGDTCLVAEQQNQDGQYQLAGGVIAFRPPHQPKVLFVWQIGVLPEARQQGLAKRMLGALLQFPACADVQYLQATVTLDNEASRRLFQSFAESQNVDCAISSFFTTDLFPTEHEAEELFSIGPLPACEQRTPSHDLSGALK